MEVNVVWILVMVSVIGFVLMLIDDRRVMKKREERCKKWREYYRIERVKSEYRRWCGEFDNAYIRGLKGRRKSLIMDLMGWDEEEYVNYKRNK